MALIIHEIFGMTDWVEYLADQVAEAGYIAAVSPEPKLSFFPAF